MNDLASESPPPSSRSSITALRPRSASLEPRRKFRRGHEQPRGVVWFGVRSFWGHLRHFAASAIATEDIDSRDWMTPDAPQELVARIAEILEGDPSAPTLREALKRDLWIDYVADTGDDVSVSRAVAQLVVKKYELDDPANPGAQLILPRGEILMFGGDTAYPVATAHEIQNRVLAPFNQVFEPADDGKERVLIGIPGNHDWYDGLDGFGRMFRLRDPQSDLPRPSVVGVSHQMLDYYAEWAREFVRGGKVEKPQALTLFGYTPVQSASYFILPVSEDVHLFAVDRQLKDIDRRQQHFHVGWYREHPEVSPWVLLPDPLYSFGQPSPTGTDMVRSLALDFEARPHFLLSGDVHHYERSGHERMLHVVAGGGGAFLHPAPMFSGRLKAEVRWPTVAQSRVLLREVPWKIALGRSGFLPHLALLALFLPAMRVGTALYERVGVFLPAPIAITCITALVLSLIGGLRRKARRVVPLALAAGLMVALLPAAASFALTKLLALAHVALPLWAIAAVTLLVAVFGGAWIFGAYLALLTRLGIEQTQAFTALDHPGFKHFLRIRVRADRSALDVFCIGLADPVAEGEQPVLVDSFSWKPDS